MPDFTAHNILFDDGFQTFPQGEPIRNSHVFLAARRLLSILYPGDRSGVRIADIGCLEGGYTIEFARLGFEAVGIEVRENNFANCTFVKERSGLQNLHFVHDNALNIDKYGPFDVIFCCGLLYHLDKPKSFIHHAAGSCRRAMIIHTHFATEVGNQRYNLSELAENEGVQGRWYTEHSDPDPARMMAAKWSSWINERSFWLRREALIQEIGNAGFDMVFEQYDALGPEPCQSMLSGYYKIHDRSMFCGVRTNPAQ